MHAFHRAVLIIKEGIIFSFPSQRNHSSPVKVSASPPAQRHVERTMSWLWEAFKQLWTSEHYFWNELSVKSLPHLKNPQSSQTMRWKVALNEGFSALLRTQFPSATSLARACCHLVDSHWLSLRTANAARWSVKKGFWIPTFFKCPAAQIFKVSKNYRPRITLKLRRISPTALSFMRNSRCNTETLQKNTPVST